MGSCSVLPPGHWGEAMGSRNRDAVQTVKGCAQVVMSCAHGQGHRHPSDGRDAGSVEGVTVGRGPRDPPEHSSFAIEASAPVCPTPQGTVGTGVWGPGPLAAPGDSCHHLSEGEDPG